MIRCATPPLLPLRMLSSSSSPSSSSSYSVNPNPRLNPIPPVLKPSRAPFFTNHSVKISPSLLQSMTLSSCFSRPTNSIPVSSLPGTGNRGPDSAVSDSLALVVVSFYKFADLPDHARMRQPLKELCQELVLHLRFFGSWFCFFYVLICNFL